MIEPWYRASRVHLSLNEENTMQIFFYRGSKEEKEAGETTEKIFTIFCRNAYSFHAEER